MLGATFRIWVVESFMFFLGMDGGWNSTCESFRFQISNLDQPIYTWCARCTTETYWLNSVRFPQRIDGISMR